MTNIATALGLRPVAPHNFSKALPQHAADPALLYGLELEIESASSDWTVGGMSVTEDGSLRNSGLEFITRPMTFSNLSFCLNNFFQKSKVTEHNYSERCSVHVHTNVQDLTFEQLSTVCAVYQVFENVLFNFIGDDRDKNIFCVPWSQTTLSYSVINSISDGDTNALKGWQKYTALNLLPIFRYGTIEWRHMAGTPDKDKILMWCNIIGAIFTWARNHSLEETLHELLLLNNNSNYRVSLQKIFGSFGEQLAGNGVEELLEEGVLNLKYAFSGATAKVVTPQADAFIPPWNGPGDVAAADELIPQGLRAEQRADAQILINGFIRATARPNPARRRPAGDVNQIPF